MLIRILGPRAPSQTWPPRPCSTRGGSPPLSATRGSRRGVPAGPRRVAPPRSTPLTSSSWAKPFAKDVAIAVPLPPVHLPPSVVSESPRRGSFNECEDLPQDPTNLWPTTPRLSPNGDTRNEKRRQLAVGRWQPTESKGQGAAHRASRAQGSDAMRCALGARRVWKRAVSRGARAHGRWRRVGGDRESGRSGERAAGSLQQAAGSERVDLPSGRLAD